ncbi:MAG: Maltose O-acetyltransferase [Candidatus Celerinatantimonas neptuna]|nr:MAG: Maltose O-acetyltransferase [Candidatus Celerinatantimonas neptuna]
MTEFEKMVSGAQFDGTDAGISRIRDEATLQLLELNQTCNEALRQLQLQKLLGHFGESSMVRSPFLCEFGRTITIGHHTFINMNVIMLDGSSITIGNHVLIGPNSQFYTAGHALDYRERRNWTTNCKPIVIEDDVWIGGNVVINQGVTIGARSVIAANSVVNQDVSPDSLYGGTPAKLIRHLDV